MRKFNKMIASLVLLVCMFALFCFSGCDILGGKGNIDVNDYVGSYKSIFIDSQKGDNSITFSLEIGEDKTFSLQGNGLEYTGSWKSYTQNGRAEILCYRITPYNPKAYFSVCMLDDGTLMATPSVTNGEYLGTVGAFGDGGLTVITLVLFEKL